MSQLREGASSLRTTWCFPAALEQWTLSRPPGVSAESTPGGRLELRGEPAGEPLVLRFSDRAFRLEEFLGIRVEGECPPDAPFRFALSIGLSRRGRARRQPDFVVSPGVPSGRMTVAIADGDYALGEKGSRNEDVVLNEVSWPEDGKFVLECESLGPDRGRLRFRLNGEDLFTGRYGVPGVCVPFLERRRIRGRAEIVIRAVPTGGVPESPVHLDRILLTRRSRSR
jgi:hypothetical protein